MIRPLLLLSSSIGPALSATSAKGVNVKQLLQKKSAAVCSQRNGFLIQSVCPPETSPVRGRLRARLWAELVMGLMSAAFLALALFSPQWMEQWVGLTPDGGDGSAEYGVALLWAAVSLLMFGLARRTWRKQIRSSSISLAFER
jgi:hypothetical protein